MRRGRLPRQNWPFAVDVWTAAVEVPLGAAAPAQGQEGALRAGGEEGGIELVPPGAVAEALPVPGGAEPPDGAMGLADLQATAVLEPVRADHGRIGGQGAADGILGWGKPATRGSSRRAMTFKSSSCSWVSSLRRMNTERSE